MRNVVLDFENRECVEHLATAHHGSVYRLMKFHMSGLTVALAAP